MTSSPKGVARLKLMLFAGWSPAWSKCSLCCREGLWSSHYVWQEFSLGGNWALARLLTGWNYSCFMAYNQMLARHHQGTRKIVISDNIFVTEKCSDGETLRWTSFNVFKALPPVWMLRSLCVRPFRALGLLVEKQKITLQQCSFMQRSAYITVKVESLR